MPELRIFGDELLNYGKCLVFLIQHHEVISLPDLEIAVQLKLHVLIHLPEFLLLFSFACHAEIAGKVFGGFLQVPEIGVKGAQLCKYVLVFTEGIKAIGKGVEGLVQVEVLSLLILFLFAVLGP